MTVGGQDQALQRDDDLTALWRQVGELIRGQSRQDVRFDRVETKLDHVKGDVAVLKTDIAETKEQLGRLERANESRFNRIDAQLERLITLIQRAETKQP